jgi:hypothetical protein
MTLPGHTDDRSRAPRGLSRNARIAMVFAGFVAIAGALLFTEHRAHVLGLLVWLPVLACLLMHVFMHGGHHGRHKGGNDAGSRSP